MKRWIEVMPVSISGVMLGMIALGSLLGVYSQTARFVCGSLGAVLFILCTAKILLYPSQIKEMLNTPESAGNAATYSMALMGISVYIKDLAGQSAVIILWAGFVLHIFLLIRFTVRYIFRLDIRKVYANYYIGYAGIASVSIASPTFRIERIGEILFWAALILVILVFIPVTYRYIRYPVKNAENMPLFCVYASPLSVCLTGYLHSAADISYPALMILFAAAMLMYLIALPQLLRSAGKTFYTSFSAFTFPFVIAATGAQQTMFGLDRIGRWLPHLDILVILMCAAAVILVGLTLSGFLNEITMKQNCK